MDLSNQLNDYVESLGGLASFTVEQRAVINSAGANVLKGAIESETIAADHVRPDGKKRKVKHLKDSVITSDTTEGSTVKDGTVFVGYASKDANHARVARFLNDGTVKMKASHFYDKAVDKSSEAVFKAQVKEINRIRGIDQ